MKAIVRRACITAAVVGAFVGQACAHQVRSAVTTVLFNDRTGAIEVMHKIDLHDGEHAAKMLWGWRDLSQDETARGNIADYVRSRFSLAVNGEAPMALEAVGEEIEGRYLWVYHEATRPTCVHNLAVSNRVFFEFWPDQRNLVNVEIGDAVHSAEFLGRSSGASEGTAQFEIDSC